MSLEARWGKCATCKRVVKVWRVCIGCDRVFCGDCLLMQSTMMTRGETFIEVRARLCEDCGDGFDVEEKSK